MGLNFEMCSEFDEAILQKILGYEKYEWINSYEIKIKMFFKYGKYDKEGNLKSPALQKNGTAIPAQIKIVSSFNIMTDNLGVLAEKLIKYGMLVEHDLGRLYISNLEEALGKVKNGNEESKLDLIGNAIAYCDLLKRHIDKEDRVVYTFAERELSEELLSEISNKCMSYEEKHDMIKEEYISILNELKNKYLK